MNQEEFNQKINNQTLPLIVEFGAVWCVPCKLMDPLLKKVEQEYEGRVEVLRVDADESQQLLQSLRVMGVPTVMGYVNHQQVFRKTGSVSQAGLRNLFEAVLGNEQVVSGPRPIDRLLRAGSGLVLFYWGWTHDKNILLLVFGLLLIFYGFYDRCMVYTLIAPRIKEWLNKQLQRAG